MCDLDPNMGYFHYQRMIHYFSPTVDLLKDPSATKKWMKYKNSDKRKMSPFFFHSIWTTAIRAPLETQKKTCNIISSGMKCKVDAR